MSMTAIPMHRASHSGLFLALLGNWPCQKLGNLHQSVDANGEYYDNSKFWNAPEEKKKTISNNQYSPEIFWRHGVNSIF